jgi:hypothetical protein
MKCPLMAVIFNSFWLFSLLTFLIVWIEDNKWDITTAPNNQNVEYMGVSYY